MNNLDNYKNESPEDAKQNTCKECGQECEKDFCSRSCLEYWINN